MSSAAGFGGSLSKLVAGVSAFRAGFLDIPNPGSREIKAIRTPLLRFRVGDNVLVFLNQ